MNNNEIANLADFVAKAIYDTTGPDGEVWGDLSEEDREDFRVAAHAAMGAHDAWLAMNGWHILKPTKMKSSIIKPAKPKLKLIGLN